MRTRSLNNRRTTSCRRLPFFGDPTNGAVFGVDVAMYRGRSRQAELDCYWDSGVRHVIVGTQVEEDARAAAGDRGRRAG